MSKSVTTSMIMVLVLVLSDPVQAQSLGDITGTPRAFGDTITAISCKTRTNNEASVRNLAKGVFNQDSATDVAVNCGWIVPQAWVTEVFPNSARIDGNITPIWVRTAGTPTADANDAFCSIFAAGTDSATSPPNVVGTNLGAARPNFSGPQASDEVSFDRVFTAGIAYPEVPGTDTASAMFTAFCRIPQGVRIQAIQLNGAAVNAHP